MIALVVSLMMGSFNPSILTVPIVHAEEPPKELSVQELKDLAASTAKKHGLKVQKFLDVIECESGWNRQARGDYRNGKPTSFGLVQIHNPVKDWGMTIEQADDPEVAFETMALKWSVGEAWRWTCWSP